MILYITVGIVLSLVFACISMLLKAKNKKTRLKKYRIASVICAVLASLPITILASFRFKLGFDITSCITIFETAGESIKTTEPIYWLLIQFIRLFTGDYRVFLVLVTFITFAILFWTIFRESENTFYSVVILILSGEILNAVNEMQLFLAISVILLTIPLIKKGEFNWVYVTLISIAAFGIHNAAIAVAPLYLLYIFNPVSWISIVIVAVSFALSGFLYPGILSVLAKYSLYADKVLKANAGIDIVRFFTFVLAFAILLITVKKIEKKNINCRMLNATCIFAMLSMGITTQSLVLGKISLIAGPFLVVYLPSAINKIAIKWLRIVSYILVAAVVSSVAFLYT